MVVDHAGRLGRRGDDRRADEFEAVGEEILREGVALGVCVGMSAEVAMIDDGVVVGDEAPEVAVEGAELFLHGEEGARVADWRRRFQAVADDAGVGEEGGDFLRVVAGDSRRRNYRRRGGALIGEDGGPAEAGLGSFRMRSSKRSRSSWWGTPTRCRGRRCRAVWWARGSG